MWRLILRMSVLISVAMVLYTQSQTNVEAGNTGDPYDTGDNDNQDTDSDSGQQNGRKKRSVINTGARAWDRCIVPYFYFGSYQEDMSMTDIGFALKLYEKYTGFRFYQYAEGATLGNNTYLNLTHTAYANFKTLSGCSSAIGRPNSGAANIQPCGGFTAVHEIGHLLGMGHEQNLPSNFGTMQYHEENIRSTELGIFKYTNSFDVYNFDSAIYDPSAFMHYGAKTFTSNKQDVITLLDQADDRYLLNAQNWYYNFRDIQEYSQCLSEYDCSAAPSCQNDGYRSIVDGVCTCICPRGLDPATGCTSKASIEQTNYPPGFYSLLMSNGTSCPTGFTSGRMVQYADGNVKNPAGSYEYISPGYTDGKLVLDVCTKDTSTGTGSWPAGNYCFLRKGGTCPSDFEEGYLHTTGIQSVTENTGELPDGTHDLEFEMYFCCRNDYNSDEEIDLPLTGTFILFQSDNKCQLVKDRYVVSSYYTFKPTVTETKNGTLPKLTTNLAGTHFYTHYCVYFPLNNDDCGAIKTLTTTDTEYTFVSPGFASGSYPPKKNCIWHITSPEGTTMQLDFNTFSVSSLASGSCESYVIVKNWHPGLKEGRVFCGDSQRTIWTQYNTLTVEFVSGPNQETYQGFNLTVKVIQDNDKCYIGDGSGGQYSGTVNYAQDFSPCLPWNQVSHCFYHRFNPVNLADDLKSNYCRSTGYSSKPWCYVEAETCQTATCDACMTGSCFDVFADCADSIAADSDYCTNNELGEAHRGCMQSCNLCAAHVPKNTVGSGAITCSMPLALTGVNMRPVKTSYSVGETVSYFCEVNKLTINRTCTSNGTWTDLTIVCGICPAGWTVYDKRCYKWLGVSGTDTMNAADAQSVCKSKGATLPRVDDENRNNFLKKMVHLVHWSAGESWLGLTKVNNEWRWADGSTPSWTNWNSNHPKNDDCVMMVASGHWETVDCSSIRYVVCEIEPSDGNNVNSCDDNMDNCTSFLADNPTACEQYADFAWSNCRRTCARGVCASDAATCTDSVDLGASGSRTYGSSQIVQGNYVEYTCNSGYYHTSGNLKRICQLDGTFSGTPPVCSDAANTDSVLITPYKALLPRDDELVNKDTILTSTNDYTKFSIPGTVTEWRYYSRMNATVAFVVLRETSPPNTFQVVGKNVMTSSPIGRKVIYHVPSADQITVQVGDRFGFYFEDLVIPFSPCDNDENAEHTGWIKSSSYNSADAITLNEESAFNVITYKPCRIYSVQAVVNPSG